MNTVLDTYMQVQKDLIFTLSRRAGFTTGAATSIYYDELLALSIRHKVLPEFADIVITTHSPAATEQFFEFKGKLQKQLQPHSIYVIQASAIISEVGQILIEKGIKTCIFKGVTCGASFYKSTQYRHCGDIDLLCDKSEVKSIVHILKSKQWSIIESNSKFDSCSFLLKHPLSSVIIDLQTSISEKRFLPHDWNKQILDDAVKIELTPYHIKCQAPSKTDHFLILCLHGFKHCWCRLHWIQDISHILSGGHITDWEYVYEKASSLRLEGIVALACSIASQISGCTVPKEFTSILRNRPQIITSRNRFLNRLFKEDFDSRERIRNIISHGLIFDTWQDSARYFMYRASSFLS